MSEKAHPQLWTNATAALTALHSTPEARAAVPSDVIAALCDAVSWGQRMEWERDQHAANAARLDAECRRALARVVELGAELAASESALTRALAERDEVWRTLCGIDLGKPPKDMVSEFLQDPKQRSLFLAAWAEDARALVAEHTETYAALTRAREALDPSEFWAQHRWPEFADQPMVAVRAFADHVLAALADATGTTNTEGNGNG